MTCFLPSFLLAISTYLLLLLSHFVHANRQTTFQIFDPTSDNTITSNIVESRQLPLRTEKRWIVDKQGRRVKLACVNWHGAHMNTFAPSGLHFQTSRFIANQLRQLGFNCVRLNWSLELFYKNPIVKRATIKAMYDHGVFASAQVLRALEVLDRVVSDLAAENIMIILDNHMSDAGWCCDPRDKNGLWFNERYTEEDYFRAWEQMAGRYASEPYVVGTDLRNEIRPDIRIRGQFVRGAPLPHVKFILPTWGGGNQKTIMEDFAPRIMNYSHPDIQNDPKLSGLLEALKGFIGSAPVEAYDWHAAATEVGNRIIAANPNVLVIVPGVFDLNSYVPNAMQLLFWALKYDTALHNTIGRFYSIPQHLTQFSQIQNLTGIRNLPVRLKQQQRLVYSAHSYPFYYWGSQFSWNGTDPTYANYKYYLDKYWGYIFLDEWAPLWIGETGNDARAAGMSGAWLNYTLRYLRENDLDFAYWPIADSRPTIDWLGRFHAGFDDYALLNRTFNGLKYPPMYESIKVLQRPQRGPATVQ